MQLSFSILLLLCSYGTPEEMLQACKCECQREEENFVSNVKRTFKKSLYLN